MIYQDHILPSVSRTFALTIPQLPDKIRPVVANAYLLCRIIDTIEDEPNLSVEAKQHFHTMFQQVVEGSVTAEEFVSRFSPRLSDQVLESEKDLIANTEKVIKVTNSFGEYQQQLIHSCVANMSAGMSFFERQASLHGLENIRALDCYCYHVAGVIGEMLTGLFCEYSKDIASNMHKMQWLAVSFGQGLQMTNIIKDIWDDRARKVCWLPRDIFWNLGFDIYSLTDLKYDKKFGAGLEYLIGLACTHLHNAMSYTLCIPSKEVGMRKFCLWAIGLALETLSNIYARPYFTAGAQVKVTRTTVKGVVLTTSMIARSDWLLNKWFAKLTAHMPQQSLAADWEPSKFNVV